MQVKWCWCGTLTPPHIRCLKIITTAIDILPPNWDFRQRELPRPRFSEERWVGTRPLNAFSNRAFSMRPWRLTLSGPTALFSQPLPPIQAFGAPATPGPCPVFSLTRASSPALPQVQWNWNHLCYTNLLLFSTLSLNAHFLFASKFLPSSEDPSSPVVPVNGVVLL